MTKIKIDALNPDSISRAADRVRKLQQAYANKNRLLVKELTKVGAQSIEETLTGESPYHAGEEETLPKYNNPHVLSGSKYGEAKATIKLSGPNAVFVEFGAGVHFNGPAGSSPHPLGEQFGYTIGSYGMGQGKNDSWQYTKDGEVKISHGTQALMPMWKASQKMRQEAKGKAKSIFSIKGI